MLWEAEDLAPLFSEAINAAEASRIGRLTDLSKEAGLPDRIVTEVATSAKYPPVLKKSVALTGPRAMAKVLNDLKVSGKYSDAGIFLTGVIALFIQGKMVTNRVEQLIEEDRRKKAEAQPKSPPRSPTL